MSQEVVQEELEVLESIYPSELTVISDREISIEVEAEDLPEELGDEQLKLLLKVHFTDDYPDSLPEMTTEALEGELTEEEEAALSEGMKSTGEENLGIAMTFALINYMKEQLSAILVARVEKQKKEEHEKHQREIEEEEARTRGTPVTVESFVAWKNKFDKWYTQKRTAEEDEKLKALSPKEREEHKKFAMRLSGRQLFERDKNLDKSDASLYEEGDVSVDVSQYERSKEKDPEEEEDRIVFEDSD